MQRNSNIYLIYIKYKRLHYLSIIESLIQMKFLTTPPVPRIALHLPICSCINRLDKGKLHRMLGDSTERPPVLEQCAL